MSKFFEELRWPAKIRYTIWSFVVLFYVAITVSVFYLSGDLFALVSGITSWFDPAFFQYNFLLYLFCISIIPMFTYFYSVRMKDEKLRRLEKQLPASEWQANKDDIKERIGDSMHIKNYLGSMAILNLIVMFGMGILLLFKPACVIEGCSGVDFSEGANFLMLGPFMQEYVEANQIEYMNWLIVSLTAFQFGFGGAYIYFLTHLVRSYFTLDLTPDMFVSSSVRMILGSVLSIVMCFAFVEIGDDGASLIFESGSSNIGFLPAFSFMIGFFPGRALMFLDKLVSSKVGWKADDYQSISMSKLSGMSYAHELRLRREGIDNVENLATTKYMDLLLRTGFSYAQLKNWIGESWLRYHLRDDYAEFRKLTGLVSESDVLFFIQDKNKSERTSAWKELLVPEGQTSSPLFIKLQVVSELVIKRNS